MNFSNVKYSRFSASLSSHSRAPMLAPMLVPPTMSIVPSVPTYSQCDSVPIVPIVPVCLFFPVLLLVCTRTVHATKQPHQQSEHSNAWGAITKYAIMYYCARRLCMVQWLLGLSSAAKITARTHTQNILSTIYSLRRLQCA